MLTFNEGDNQIEVGTGIVVREAISFVKAGANATTNDTGTSPPTPFKNRVKSKVNIYKSGKVETGWSFNSVSAYGAQKYFRPYTEYDPSAPYTATYLMLDKSPIVPFSGSYAANEKAMFQELTDAVQQNATAVSVLMNKKADKDTPSPQWIIPTLLNGWEVYGSPWPSFKYYKDSNNIDRIIGAVKNGTGTMFTLPKGYRPLSQMGFSLLSLNGTVVVPASINVQVNGTVNAWHGVNNSLVIVDISFLAEL